VVILGEAIDISWLSAERVLVDAEESVKTISGDEARLKFITRGSIP